MTHCWGGSHISETQTMRRHCVKLKFKQKAARLHVASLNSAWQILDFMWGLCCFICSGNCSEQTLPSFGTLGEHSYNLTTVVKELVQSFDSAEDIFCSHVLDVVALSLNVHENAVAVFVFVKLKLYCLGRLGDLEVKVLTMNCNVPGSRLGVACCSPSPCPLISCHLSTVVVK